MNINEWTVSNDTVGTWQHYGVAGESTRYIGQDPWLNSTILWESNKTDSTGGTYEGGWGQSAHPTIDINHLHRNSVWIYRITAGVGRFLFGVNGYNTANTEVGLARITDSVTETNNYFTSDGSRNITQQGSWLLAVGHVYPYGHTGTTMHVDSGIWSMNGTKYASTTADYKFISTSTRMSHRAFIYDGLEPSRYIFVYPRIDCCDGTQPTLQQLLRHQTFHATMNFGLYNLAIQCKDVVYN